MSNVFGLASYRRLNTIHPALKVLCIAILERMDVSIVCGYRGEEEQNEAYKNGKSGLQFPQSKHNHSPSSAVDIAPYISGKGIRWNASEVAFMQGRIQEIADYLSIPIRWGADWDGDGDIVEHKLKDYVHIEINIEEINNTVWRYL